MASSHARASVVFRACRVIRSLHLFIPLPRVADQIQSLDQFFGKDVTDDKDLLDGPLRIALGLSVTEPRKGRCTEAKIRR